MKKYSAAKSVRRSRDFLQNLTLPSGIRALIDQGQQEFAKRQRFEGNVNCALHTLTAEQKIQHYRNSACSALVVVGTEGGGQPPMIERLRAAAIMVDWLETQGVHWAVSRNSIMNKAILKLLNDEAASSTDTRKSRRKQITPDAVRILLRQVAELRSAGRLWVQFRPYAETDPIGHNFWPLNEN